MINVVAFTAFSGERRGRRYPACNDTASARVNATTPTTTTTQTLTERVLLLERLAHDLNDQLP